MPDSIEILTSRLRLRNWCPADKPPFAELNADSRVTPFLRGPMSRDESNAMADRLAEHIRAHGFGFMAMEIPGRTTFAGFVGLAHTRFEAPFTPCIQVGWRLLPAHWGHGFATEGALASLDVAFGELGLDEVVSFTSVNNERSRRVMDRIGMRHDPSDDFLHPRLDPGHPLRPHVLYRITASEHSSRGEDPVDRIRDPATK